MAGDDRLGAVPLSAHVTFAGACCEVHGVDWMTLMRLRLVCRRVRCREVLQVGVLLGRRVPSAIARKGNSRREWVFEYQDRAIT